ncbi:hypothetical protein DNTS_023075, partial [Danionella cerebrum]
VEKKKCIKSTIVVTLLCVNCRYEVQALIGRGSFSRVVRAKHRQTHEPVAIKLLERRTGYQSYLVELGVLQRVKHQNVIQLKEVFQTPHRIYLVLELATGGELLERVIARGTFRERDATWALRMVVSGLTHLHSLGIIHRDLKPENLLYYHPGKDSRLIITDFGLAWWNKKLQGVSFENVESTVTSGQSVSACGGEQEAWAVRTLCGTPEFLAPETVARRPCGTPVDMWALGIISFILLSGSMPFQQSSQTRLFRAILNGRYNFSGDSFISELLTLEPGDRMSAQQALQHPWLLSMASSSSNKNLHRSISRNLQRQASRASGSSWRSSSSVLAPGSRISQRSGQRRIQVTLKTPLSED